MKVKIRKLKFKYRLEDGSISKRWRHIPDDVIEFYDTFDYEGCQSILEYPDENDPERNEKLKNIKYNAESICIDDCSYKWPPKGYCDENDPWLNIVVEVDYSLYRL